MSTPQAIKVIPEAINVAWRKQPGPVQLAVKNAGGTDITSECTFATENGAVAVVSTAGLVSLRGKGKCAIKVSKADGSMATVPVVVAE